MHAGPKPWPHELATHTGFQANEEAERQQHPAQPSLAVQPAIRQIHPGESFDSAFQILLCSPGRLHTQNPPDSAPRTLGLQVWATVPSLGYFLNALDFYVKFHFNQSRMPPSSLTRTPCPCCSHALCVIRANSHCMSGSLTYMLDHILKSHETCMFKYFFLQNFRTSAYKSTLLFEMIEWGIKGSTDPICI